MPTIVDDADDLTFEDVSTPGGASLAHANKVTKGTFVGLGPTAPESAATHPSTQGKAASRDGAASTIAQATGSLKATLLGASPNMAMLPRKGTPPPSAVSAAQPASGSLKSTLLGASPNMAMVPQKTAPAAATASPAAEALLSASLKPTLAGPSLFGADQGELAPDAVFATAFKIVRTVLKGRASVLYEATLQGVGRKHALKVFRRSPGVDEQALQRFVHDARVGSRVESEHLIEVSRAGYDGASGCAWVASELLEGESLATRLAALGEGSTLPVDHAWRVLSGVCRGLAKAHQQGVVHGELRPSNVLLASGGADPFDVKLVDFGVAHLVTAWPDAMADTSWRAPELPSAEVTPAADVWSVGLLAFLLFTGHDYWQGTARDDRIERRIVPASARAEALGCSQRLPRGFDAWFAQCVSRVPASRFKSARELVPALEALQTAGSNVPVLEYTPSRGASATASASGQPPSPPTAQAQAPQSQAPQLPQRKVTTRPSAPPSTGALEERSSRPSFSAPPSVTPRRAPRSPIHAPVLPEDPPQRARISTPPSAPSSASAQSVRFPQDPQRTSALQHPTPLHGTPRGSWPPSPSPLRHVTRASPPHPTSPPQGIVAPYTSTRPSRPPSPPQGVATNASASGAQSALTTTGAQRALTGSGAQRALTSSGANHALTTTGAQRALADPAEALAIVEAAQREQPVRPAQLTPPSESSAIVATRSSPPRPAPSKLPTPRQPPSLPPPQIAAPPAAPAGYTRRTVAMLALGAGVLSFTLVGVVVGRAHDPDAATVETAPALQAPPPAPVLARTPAPPILSGRRWNGSLTTADSRWSFVLSLRVNGATAAGWFSWTAAQVPGARVGEQVRENLEGTFDPTTGTFDVHGTGSSNQGLLPVNAYRVRVLSDGSIEGSTLDASERIVGTPAR